MEKARAGLHIGVIYVGMLTCADDVLFLSTLPPKLQTMLTTAKNYSVGNLYELHPTKSITNCPLNLPDTTGQLQWYLREDRIPDPVVDEFTHLGLIWTTGRHSPDISKLIQSATWMAYTLLGEGNYP